MQVQQTTPVSTGCCPPFAPEPWDDKELHWNDKLFVKAQVRGLFHVPLGMGAKMAKSTALIKAADAEGEAHLTLSDDQSPWHSELLIEVKKAVPGATMGTLSGTYLTKVFEGPFRDAGKWVKEMAGVVAAKGRALEKIYLGYTTCPKCAKAYGKNYVVLFAKVDPPA